MRTIGKVRLIPVYYFLQALSGDLVLSFLEPGVTVAAFSCVTRWTILETSVDVGSTILYPLESMQITVRRSRSTASVHIISYWHRQRIMAQQG